MKTKTKYLIMIIIIQLSLWSIPIAFTATHSIDLHTNKVSFILIWLFTFVLAIATPLLLLLKLKVSDMIEEFNKIDAPDMIIIEGIKLLPKEALKGFQTEAYDVVTPSLNELSLIKWNKKHYSGAWELYSSDVLFEDTIRFESRDKAINFILNNKW